jgi:glutamate/tyrosine decarboxylase-like PLP-dependent enzyme
MESNFRETLGVALQRALEHLEGLDSSPVAATADLATLRKRLLKPLNESSMDSAQVIEELVGDVRGGILGSAGGRFFGWVIGGAVPAALAADWLTSAWDQNAARYACGPAAAVVEEAAGAWIKEILHLPARASFAFVTGCQMAHVTCLAAARHALLAARGWNVEERGLSGAPAIRIVTSGLRHGSIERAVRLLGLGLENIVDLPADSQGRLQLTDLEQELRRELARPAIVLLQAGDINTGAFDPFPECIAIAKRHSAWVHVDGAFGLWAAASPQYRHLLHGVEQADSWATDGHKWLNVPFDSGYAIVADHEAHRASMLHRAPYLVHAADARDEGDWNPEWSRRARGFATYAALRQLGKSGVADIVERCCRHARALVLGIGKLPGAQLLWEPVINQGLVRFLDPSVESDAAAHDRYTEAVIARILATGEAFFGPTTWRGLRCMRVSVCNWRTSESDVQRAIRAAASALAPTYVSG